MRWNFRDRSHLLRIQHRCAVDNWYAGVTQMDRTSPKPPSTYQPQFLHVWEVQTRRGGNFHLLKLRLHEALP